MNFQVTVLKILVSYPDGFAVMEDLKRDMAILATSGRVASRLDRPGSRRPASQLRRQVRRPMDPHWRQQLHSDGRRPRDVRRPRLLRQG
ncbi:MULTISPECIES: hypothetical protein [Bradyrhizobium]|uniref:hypothetical protein n=1 Tax=Bradyrhizobium TaxID=374 RepID=UPI0004B88DC4|nr:MULTISPECIES: hypothetical protein [Bradyrhizobium]MBR1367522.1 hypothetical protein [Bradyrhizobium ottawaense]